MRKILSFEETNDILAPYLKDYIDCLKSAFIDFVKINEFKNSLEVYSDFAIHTRASIIHDRICGHLTTKFGSSSDIKVGKWNQVFGLQFSDLILLRSKKFRKDRKISGYNTKQHRKFMKNGLIEGFPEESTFIIGGYIPNDSYTELKGIYLSCWGPDGLEWISKVGEYVVEQGKIVFPEVKTTDSKGRRVKPKKTGEEDAKTGTDN